MAPLGEVITQSLETHARPPGVAVKPGGSGDITQTHVAWKFNRGLPYVASPLFYESRVYLIRDGGMMSSFDAKTGKPFYTQERIGAIGVCGSGSFGLAAAETDPRIKAVATVSMYDIGQAKRQGLAENVDTAALKKSLGGNCKAALG